MRHFSGQGGVGESGVPVTGVEVQDAKTKAFDDWLAGTGEVVLESVKLDGSTDIPNTNGMLVEIGFREGWDAAMAARSELEQAGVDLAKFLAPHVAKLSGTDFAAVWYPMQAALAKAGAR